MPKVIKRIIIGVVIIGVIGAAAAFFVMPAGVASLLSKTAAMGDEVVVTSKTMSFWVDATGALRATSVANFGAPTEFRNYWQFQIVNMVQEGKNVKAGDVIINFEAQKIRDDLQRVQTELDQAKKELEKTTAQIDLERQDLKSKLANAENNYEKAKLKQRVGQQEKLKDVQLDEITVEQARREVEALRARIEWHQKASEATHNLIVGKQRRAENRVNEIKEGLDRFQIKADRDGVLVYKTKWNNERFKVGETVWSGQSVAEIPDLNTILAAAYVPEVDLGKVKAGQRVELTIDAFPGKTYTGMVKGLGRLVRAKSWDIPNKILDVEITLDKLDISIMRPAMSIKAKIETASIPDCLVVPLKAVRNTADGAALKVKTEQGWREQAVKLGESNGAEVVVTEGVKAGEHIAADFSKAK